MGAFDRTVMNFLIPRRFSREWWLTLAVTAAGVGLFSFAWFQSATGLSTGQIVLACLGLSAVTDIIMALGMEAVAPTRVVIGPGERRYHADRPDLLAVVISGFRRSRTGLVSVRGETWTARLPAETLADISAGSLVRITERDGLTLLIAPAERPADN
jgi:membrane-bound ClpP family serine protease